jgi:hypothetical protein
MQAKPCMPCMLGIHTQHPASISSWGASNSSAEERHTEHHDGVCSRRHLCLQLVLPHPLLRGV